VIHWVVEIMKEPNIQSCDTIESRMNEIIMVINQTHSIVDADKFHSELCILDRIFYQVCNNETKKFERL
jgi:hypothetical protein